MSKILLGVVLDPSAVVVVDAFSRGRRVDCWVITPRAIYCAEAIFDPSPRFTLRYGGKPILSSHVDTLSQ